MRQFILLLASALLAEPAFAREITANLSWAAFAKPDSKTYVETYLSVIGQSVTYLPTGAGGYQAGVDVFMTFTRNDSIISAKRYTLNSPVVSDSAKVQNFLDLQRVNLPLGIYDLQIVLSDKNKKDAHLITNHLPVVIDIDPDSASLSNIEFLESYTPTITQNMLSKSGYDVVPYVSSFYPENMDKLSFYAELYNVYKSLGPDEKFVVLFSIESAETGNRMNDFSSFTKMIPNKVNIILSAFDITKLPNGRYNLVIEVRNGLNKLMTTRRASFERFNPTIARNLQDIGAVDVAGTFASRITEKDSLIQCMRCLRPISSEGEKDYAETIIKGGDTKAMQQYVYNFWVTRNAENPEGAWLTYNLEVKKVNKEFSTPIMKGYETDRGRVYLQYGPPDQRTVMNNEPSSYPYEIWQYYTIRGNMAAAGNTSNQPSNTTQTNKRFVFGNFDLVTNNYALIHSDARGEVRDERWRVRLTKRDNSNRNLDNGNGNSQYGGQADDLFNNPR